MKFDERYARDGNALLAKDLLATQRMNAPSGKTADPHFFAGFLRAAVQPSPATHPILTVSKAGESVFQTPHCQKQCLVHLEEHNHCFMQFLASKHCLGHLWASPLMKTGYGARKSA